MKVSRLWKRGGRVRAKGITILKFEGKTDCFPNEREPTTWELLRGERRFSNIYGKRSVNETEPWQTEPEGYRVPFQNLPFPLSRYAIVPARCETLPVESRYSIDHNARRKKERKRSNVEFRKGALFISRNEFRGAKKSMDVQWREYPSYLFPFPLSLSPLVRPSYPFISRVLLLCAFLHLCRRARWMVAICFSLREIATRYFSRARQTTLTIGHHRP